MRSIKKERYEASEAWAYLPLGHLGHAPFAGTAIFGNKYSLYTCCIHHDTLMISLQRHNSCNKRPSIVKVDCAAQPRCNRPYAIAVLFSILS